MSNIQIYIIKFQNFLNKISLRSKLILYIFINTAYGAHQRESIKTSFNDASDRDDVKILTRPVAAAVIQNNQNAGQIGIDNFKLVFDMTDNSMDASVIKIHEGKDFQVVSNVGDTNFGVHDIDQRIVEYIIKERTAHHLSIGKEDLNATSVETVNAYNHLIKSIKESVVESDAVSVDLATLADKKVDKPKSSNEVTITKKLIGKKLCKDIYDWSLVHIEKAIIQADIDYKHVDEIILIGSEAKFPGFKELLKETYPKKKITFVSEADLAVGAAIVKIPRYFGFLRIFKLYCIPSNGLFTNLVSVSDKKIIYRKEKIRKRRNLSNSIKKIYYTKFILISFLLEFSFDIFKVVFHTTTLTFCLPETLKQESTPDRGLLNQLLI
ncbi:heat shock [Brachionus plicatilis]|uniref:Heat shock n=1 Tax=Brachionus plicatilis TaxID=10195 RepID=A0A3M7QYX4_BRAPC|nr:heat shock [Brachionus plicatilis]